MKFLEQNQSAKDRTKLYMENNPSLKLREELLLTWLKDLGEVDEDTTLEDVIFIGDFYDLDMFSVEGVDGEFTVGTDNEMMSSSKQSLEEMIDEMGYEGFSRSLLEEFIDEEEVSYYAKDFYEDDVYSNPESYLDDDKRMLSNKQKEQVDIFEMRKDRLNRSIEQFLNGLGGENDEWYRRKIKELEGIVEEFDEEIEMIKGDPDGDYPEELVSQVIDDNVREVKRNPMQFIDDFGLDFSNFINKKKFIEEIINTDGYGHTLNRYDGSADEVFVDGDLFFIMRID